MERAVSVIVVNQEDKILALRRDPRSQWLPGKWDIIFGKTRPNETPNECFRRALWQAIGIADYLLVERKSAFSYQDGGSELFIYPYLCRINDESEIKLNHDYQGYRWATFNELFALNHSSPLRTILKLFNDSLAPRL